MPRRSTRPPKYRKHKAAGQAVVTLSGRDRCPGSQGKAELVEAMIKVE